MVTPGGLSPIPGVTVTLAPLAILGRAPSKTVQVFADESGKFRIDSIAPARYLMSVRRLGFVAAQDTILVARDSGIVAAGILVSHNMIIDECGMMYQEVRVPWWKRN